MKFTEVLRISIAANAIASTFCFFAYSPSLLPSVIAAGFGLSALALLRFLERRELRGRR